MARWLIALLLFALIAALGVGAWQWQWDNLTQPLTLDTTGLTPLLEELITATEELTPEPLRGPLAQINSTLTTAGILMETNRQRATENLAALQANSTLDQAAQRKVNDMFARQYFAHEAPDGTGPGDLVDGVGYTYIRVGENLALGNFASDAALVQAWMDSPGHRANIMHQGFSEIGLAVKKGMFEGSTVWLAVQTFAAPLSSCPAVDGSLQKKFDDLKANLDSITTQLQGGEGSLVSLQQELEALADDIEALAQAGQAKIAAGNEKIKQGNEVYEETGDREQAQPYWDEGEKIQSEGEALLAEATAKQGTYTTLAKKYEQQRSAFNQQVQTQQTLNEELQSVLSKLNQQIRAFNACIK